MDYTLVNIIKKGWVKTSDKDLGLVGGLKYLLDTQDPGIKILDFLEARRGFAFHRDDIALGADVPEDEAKTVLAIYEDRHLVEPHTDKDGVHYSIADNKITKCLLASVLHYRIEDSKK